LPLRRRRPHEKIRRIIKAHLTPLLDRRPYLRTFLNERQHLPSDSRRRIGRLSWAYEHLKKVLKSGVRDGEFRRDLDCRLAALALLGVTNAVAAWYGKETKATVDTIASEYARLYLSGTGRRAGARGAR